MTCGWDSCPKSAEIRGWTIFTTNWNVFESITKVPGTPFEDRHKKQNKNCLTLRNREGRIFLEHVCVQNSFYCRMSLNKLLQECFLCLSRHLQQLHNTHIQFQSLTITFSSRTKIFNIFNTTSYKRLWNLWTTYVMTYKSWRFPKVVVKWLMFQGKLVESSGNIDRVKFIHIKILTGQENVEIDDISLAQTTAMEIVRGMGTNVRLFIEHVFRGKLLETLIDSSV